VAEAMVGGRGLVGPTIDVLMGVCCVWNTGTTKKGIGPAYAAKINRVGCRVGDLQNWEEFEARFRVRTMTFGDPRRTRAAENGGLVAGGCFSARIMPPHSFQCGCTLLQPWLPSHPWLCIL
jgi:hypothetical protein